MKQSNGKSCCFSESLYCHQTISTLILALRLLTFEKNYPTIPENNWGEKLANNDTKTGKQKKIIVLHPGMEIVR